MEERNILKIQRKESEMEKSIGNKKTTTKSTKSHTWEEFELKIKENYLENHKLFHSTVAVWPGRLVGNRRGPPNQTLLIKEKSNFESITYCHSRRPRQNKLIEYISCTHFKIRPILSTLYILGH